LATAQSASNTLSDLSDLLVFSGRRDLACLRHLGCDAIRLVDQVQPQATLSCDLTPEGPAPQGLSTLSARTTLPGGTVDWEGGDDQGERIKT